MGATVRELQRRMDAREFQEWQEYYKIEPFGDDWDQAATVAAATVNSNPFAKRSVKPERFIPRAKFRQTAEEIERQMMHFAKMHNATIRKRAQQTLQP